MPVEKLKRPDSVELAYDYLPGAGPVVVFLPGFASDMNGAKALHLAEICRARGQAMLRLDYSGHGASGGRFAEGGVGIWAEDAAMVIEAVTAGRLLLVGSSMGGWIALLLAFRFMARLEALLLIAPAPDFTERMIRPGLTPAHLDALETQGWFEEPSEYGAPLPITARLLEDGAGHTLLHGPIAIPCPVTILHGMRDADVPWQQTLELIDYLESEAVEVTFIKDGDHRLSRPADLALLGAALGRLLGQDGA